MGFGYSGHLEFMSACLQSREWLRLLERDAGGARADLDEAWDMGERGSMRLHLADIHRARLFFREEIYPWNPRRLTWLPPRN
jgi:hypothetical protein